MASRGKLADAFARLNECGADTELIGLTKECLELEPVDRPRDSGVLAQRVTEYLESVQEKLREAEVQRAAEAARAEAESATSHRRDQTPTHQSRAGGIGAVAGRIGQRRLVVHGTSGSQPTNGEG